MAKFTLAACLAYLIGWAASTFSSGSLLGVLEDLGFLALLISGAYYGFRLLFYVRRRLLWKVRNKIIISYAFVGILPVLILLLISGIVFYLAFKQLTSLYLETELETVADALEDAQQEAVVNFYRDLTQGAVQGALSLLGQHSVNSLERLPLAFDQASVVLYPIPDRPPPQGSPAGSLQLFREAAEERQAQSSLQFPDWLEDGFEGFVSHSNGLFLARARRLLTSNEGQYLLIFQLPFDEQFLDYVENRTSMQMIVTEPGLVTPSSEFQMAYSNFTNAQRNLSVSWAHFFSPVNWGSGDPDPTRALLVSVPIWTLLNFFFAQATGPILIFVAVLGVLFLLVALTALFIGIVIARSITRSVHNIYVGTRHIQRGDFSFRIPTQRRDQLDSMAESFNQMSGSILRLMREVSEKEFLEKEIEIAREVQKQLFPQQLPQIKKLEIAASCSPARQVSGDYYDFIPHGTGAVDIIIGDISGKGISAALLMASIQSAIRSQLQFQPGLAEEKSRVSHAVEKINRQLYRQSANNKFSTLVLSHFNSNSMSLTYCNAGHHHPLLFSNGEVRRLQTGGTVAGMFENGCWEAETIQLKARDLLLFYTDGVTEATNSVEEEFGETRLVKLVSANTFLTAEDIRNLIRDAIDHWSGDTEQGDDITVVCLKLHDSLQGQEDALGGKSEAPA